jgi:integrase
MTVNLTQRAVKALTPPEKGRAVVWDAQVRGLAVRLTDRGARSWVVVYRHGGRVRWYTIGAADVLDIDEARKRARRILVDVDDGKDPAAERKAREVAAQREREAQLRAEQEERERQDDTFGALADLYVEKYAKVRKRSWAIDARAIARDLSDWRKRPARDITATDVAALVERIAVDRNAPAQATRTRAVVSKVFTFALKSPIAQLRFRVVANPVQGTEVRDRPRERDRVLTPAEIRAVWTAIEQQPAPVATIFKLYLLTAQRGGEIRSMRRENLDLETAWWTVPAERAKNKLAHRVPLSPAALALVKAQLDRVPTTTPWLFPAENGRSRTPYRSSIQHPIARVREASGVDFWPHDLRRTAASHMAGTGVQRLVIGRILNHIESGVTKVYDRHSYDPEKRQALDAWARRLHQIVTGESAAKVVPIRNANIRT